MFVNFSLWYLESVLQTLALTKIAGALDVRTLKTSVKKVSKLWQAFKNTDFFFVNVLKI